MGKLLFYSNNYTVGGMKRRIRHREQTVKMTMDEKRITGHGQGADAGGKEKRKCRAGTMKTRGQLDKGPLVTMYSTLEASGNTVEKSLFCTKIKRRTLG
jgi:hypothetical protein